MTTRRACWTLFLVAGCSGSEGDDPSGGETGEVPTAPEVRINEFLASNVAATPGPHGDFPDWIELVNTSGEAVDLSGVRLADDLDAVDDAAALHGVRIEARGFLVLWADGSGDDESVSFKLAAGGEAIALWGPDGALWDSVVYSSQLPDVSSARRPDAEGEFEIDATPTPGEANGR